MDVDYVMAIMVAFLAGIVVMILAEWHPRIDTRWELAKMRDEIRDLRRQVEKAQTENDGTTDECKKEELKMGLVDERTLSIYPEEGSENKDWIEVKLYGDEEHVSIHVPVRDPHLMDVTNRCGVVLNRRDVEELASRILGYRSTTEMMYTIHDVHERIDEIYTELEILEDRLRCPLSKDELAEHKARLQNLIEKIAGLWEDTA